MKDFTSRTKKNIYLALAIGFTISLWQAASILVGKPILVPSPAKTFVALVDILMSDDFWVIVGHTLRRMLIGFMITSIFAIILGIISGLSEIAEYLLKPIVMIFKSVPTMAIILLALIWLSSENAPMFVGALICFPVIYQNILRGVREVDTNLIEMAEVFGVKKQRVLADIYLPSVKPFVISALSTASGLYVKVVIAAEVLSQPRYAIGTSFQIAKSNLDTAGVFAWTIIAIAIASVFDFAIKQIGDIR